MSEMAKTIAFVAAAAGSLLLAFVVGSNVDQFDAESLVGKRLNEFGVDAPTRLKIVKYDAETAATREFEVASAEGLWTIPSKQDYPADAAQQMAEAATCLIDREILRVAATDASQHQELGVVDPNSVGDGTKAEGVGTRVSMTDINDEELTNMVIGKPVKDAEGQFHVRKVDQDLVYVVSLNPEKLSTRFEDWIEDDLLKINPSDIDQIVVKDYSVEMQQVLTDRGFQMQVAWDRRGEFTLGYDGAASEWAPEKLQQFDVEKKELVDFALAEDEELNSEVLTELRDGLDDLLLVDVERKPTGLSADLKAGEGFLNNQEAIENLVGRGFAPITIDPANGAEILSSEGEVVCTLKDGVEYALRFGNLKVGGETSSDENAAGDETAEDSNSGIHRYLFVMARLNESVIEKPELAALPALPEDSAEGAEAEESETQATTKEAETTEGETVSAEAAETELAEENDAEAEATEENADSEQEEAEADTEESVTEESGTEEEAESDDSEASTEESEEEEEAPSDKETILAERKRIEEENQRLLDEYDEKIAAAKERVHELNERFGDWYYVISNNVYKKIHLGKDQLITKKKDPAEEPAAGAPGIPAGGGIPGLPNFPAGN